MDELDKLVRAKMKEQGEKVGGLKVEVTEETFQKMRDNILDELNKTKLEVSKAYEDIIKILRTYCDLQENYYSIIALWIVGTYIYKEFTTYPYLYFNAMKGSGKSRLVELISTMSYNGKLVNDITEAVLFRTCEDSTICMDEFENIGRKENNVLRVVLNSGYKKGVAVERMKKVSTKEGEKQVVERFNLYSPKVMANIWGMDEVLEDRCISLVIEKSHNPGIVKLIQDFDTNPLIDTIKKTLQRNQCCLCRVVTLQNVYKGWNNYVLSKYNDTHNTYNNTHTDNTNDTTTGILEDETFNKIDSSDINSRDLELFLPLLTLANTLDWVLFDNLLKIFKEIVKERKTEEYTENRDITFMDFISQQTETSHIQITEIRNRFQLFLGDIDEDDKWVNNKWIGKALKRLGLIKDKKRVAKGREIILNISKAQDKIKMFK